MSYISDAVQGVCTALDYCFAGYCDSRSVSTSVRFPMGTVAIVDFSVTARGFEMYGSLAVVVDVADWSGVCFIVHLSERSGRWLRSGPIRIGSAEVVQELVSACSDVDCFDIVVPPRDSTACGFLFDLGAR